MELHGYMKVEIFQHLSSTFSTIAPKNLLISILPIFCKKKTQLGILFINREHKIPGHFNGLQGSNKQISNGKQITRILAEMRELSMSQMGWLPV